MYSKRSIEKCEVNDTLHLRSRLRQLGFQAVPTWRKGGIFVDFTKSRLDLQALTLKSCFVIGQDPEPSFLLVDFSRTKIRYRYGLFEFHKQELYDALLLMSQEMTNDETCRQRPLVCDLSHRKALWLGGMHFS
jgi:hypothetical protein